MTKKLWERHTAFFVIEIKVGNIWVEQARGSTEEQALGIADKILHDPAVRSVRITSHTVKHVATVVHEKSQSVVMRLPPKMTPTGRNALCPRCKTGSTVASDGILEWIFCPKCQTALPGENVIKG